VFSDVVSIPIALRRTVTGLDPSVGASGTFVIIHGIGFVPSDEVSFAATGSGFTVTAPTIFLDSNNLGTYVPVAVNDGKLSAFPSGPASLILNGVAVQPFYITDLPANPTAPGTILRSLSSALAKDFAADTGTITLAINALKRATADANAQMYLQALSDLLPAYADFLETDMPDVLEQQDSGNVSCMSECF